MHRSRSYVFQTVFQPYTVAATTSGLIVSVRYEDVYCQKCAQRTKNPPGKPTESLCNYVLIQNEPNIPAQAAAL